MDPRQQQIVRDFARRRGRELALIPLFIAGIWPFAAVLRFHEPTVFGLSPTPAMAAGGLLLAACLGLHMRNWRCPACEAYLGGGLNRALCGHCGALFHD